MEVALACPRTPEQYVHGLRDGLELTERMRALVEAIREVVDIEEERREERKEEDSDPAETTELKPLLQQTVDDLAPVAESKNVSLALECSEASPAVRAGRRGLASAVFRILESALSLAARGTELRIETGSAAGGAWLRIRWQAGPTAFAFSRSELGLLVAQAGLERAGAEWQRERTENGETLTIRLAGAAGGGGKS
jgi:hypothetical protein